MKQIFAIVLMALFSQFAIAERLIIQTENSDLSELLSEAAGYNIDLNSRMAAPGFYTYNLPDGLPAEAIDGLLQLLGQFTSVKSVEVDVMLHPTFVPNDTRYNEQWHYYEAIGGIGLPVAWDTSTGTGAIVAVLDTGYVTHDDLNANIINGYDFISDAGVGNDGNGRDADASDPGDWEGFFECGFTFGRNSTWHGTHVAGTVAAVTGNGSDVAGVAFDSQVLVVRVLGKCGGFLSDISDAVIWASGGNVTGVPANANPAQVINLSLGGTGACSAAMQTAVNIAVGNGTAVVVAAGNSNANVSNHTPSNCNNVIAVAANDREGNRASYSNFGDGIDVTAPGGETANSTANGVLSTLNSGAQGPGAQTLEFYQGTSMAAPHVAGVAALLYSSDPTLTPAEVEQILKDTARPLPGTCSGGCGAGIIDTVAALGAVDGLEPLIVDFNINCPTDTLTCTFVAGTQNDDVLVSWDWTFGDGGTSTLEDPSHTYPASDIYEICLTVEDTNGRTDTGCRTTTVVGPNFDPIASFTSDCNELTCAFTDTSTDPDANGRIRNWNWTFGDGNTSTQQNPLYGYTTAGTYHVCLTVRDNRGDSSATVCNPVQVTEPVPNVPPTASFTYSCNNLVCNFTDTSTDSDGTVEDWNWSFGDGGNSVQQNPSHTYASEGTYNVCHSVDDDDNDESANSCQNVTVTDPPPPPPPTCRWFFFGRCWG